MEEREKGLNKMRKVRLADIAQAVGVSAVTVQMTRVAKHTSNIPQKPSAAGLLASAAAWAMAEDPTPASLVNTPRATP